MRAVHQVPRSASPSQPGNILRAENINIESILDMAISTMSIAGDLLVTSEILIEFSYFVDIDILFTIFRRNRNS